MKRSLVVDASLLSSKRWRLRLDCGHELWIMLTHRPAIGGHVMCSQCISEGDEK